MKRITCCKDCKPPKRYPGCGANCEDYALEKQKLQDEKKARLDFLKKQNDVGKVLYGSKK